MEKLYSTDNFIISHPLLFLHLLDVFFEFTFMSPIAVLDTTIEGPSSCLTFQRVFMTRAFCSLHYDNRYKCMVSGKVWKTNKSKYGKSWKTTLEFLYKPCWKLHQVFVHGDAILKLTTDHTGGTLPWTWALHTASHPEKKYIFVIAPDFRNINCSISCYCRSLSLSYTCARCNQKAFLLMI